MAQQRARADDLGRLQVAQHGIFEQAAADAAASPARVDGQPPQDDDGKREESGSGMLPRMRAGAALMVIDPAARA
jgi:hypothetical protein